MDSKYPVGTPEWVVEACEELYENADQLMLNHEIHAEYARGYYAAAYRMRQLTEHFADLDAAKKAEAIKAAGDRIRKETLGQRAEPQAH